MNNVDKSMDELIWTVAESRDQDLENEFCERYPQLRAQLATRKAMVQVLRDARPAPASIPAYREPAARRRNDRWWLVPAAAAALATVAFGSYRVTLSLQRDDSPKAVASSPNTTFVAPNEPDVNVPPANVTTPPAAPNENPNKAGARPAPTPTEPMIAVSTEKATLFGVLNALSASGTKLEVMPDVKDQPLTLTPNRQGHVLALTAIEMLRKLEEAADIRVVDNGTDGIIIVPLNKVRNADENVGIKAAPDDKSAISGVR